MKLALWPKKSISQDTNIAEQVASATEFTIGQNVITKEEVDTAMIQAEKAGAKIIKVAQETFYAGYFQDSDGHIWEIVYNPSFLPEE